ncbi:acetylcholine receptor subunit alpha-like [Plakobranchus ocellatus]|uniref:Acetylcholine receptor subunit alpha-like n=1 Tax=Plakobranchus ocellatus TaxID=259542 RepID=A0AAV4C6Q3_9GAST|nr:acetylcholine receptor subunit alpha-like [Plakobranchus ocellatus]
MGPLISRLRKKSDPDLMPSGLKGEALEVILGLSFINIAAVDVRRGEVELLIWQTISWRDPDLAWWPFENYNVTSVKLPTRYLWTPDIAVFNGASPVEEISPLLASVESDGSVTLLPSVRMRVLCDASDMSSEEGVDGKVTCVLRLGSWTYNAGLLTLAEPDDQTLDTSGFFQGSQYELLHAEVHKNVALYACCSEPFEDMQFFFTFRRKPQMFPWRDEDYLNEQVHSKTRFGS